MTSETTTEADMTTADADTDGRSGLRLVYWAVAGLIVVGVAVGLLELKNDRGPASSPTPTAQSVVDHFADEGLAVPNGRDNSHNCADLGCEQMITTDAITVLSFDTRSAAVDYSMKAPDTYQRGQFVLSYGAARTPVGDRYYYEAQLRVFVG
jgi:hypothetical protein